MPFLAPLGAAGITALIGGGASVAGSALSGKKKTTKQSSTPTYTPEMKALQERLLGYSNGLMADPAAGTQPIKLAGMESINRKYAGMPDAISRKMASRGYGSSGNFGNTMYQSELSRMGDMSDLEGNFAKMVLDRQDQGATIGQNLLRMGQGSEGEGTQPGNMAANGLMSAGNGLENISTMLMLSKILKP